MPYRISEREAMNQYDDALDCGDMIRIGSLEYLPSQVLRAVDPVAYNEGFADYVDSLAGDGVYVEGYADSDYPDGVDDPDYIVTGCAENDY
jgi:hypothetical protein